MAKNVLSYIGIDLGGSSIKVAEIANVNSRPQLVNYGFVDHVPSIINDDSKETLGLVTAQVKNLLKQANITSQRVVAALPNFSVFSSIINLPAMSGKDLISAVRWEAKKFVPIPLEEMILDWEVLTEDKKRGDKDKDKEKIKDKKDKKKTKTPAGPKGNIKVLLTAAPKNLVNRYVALFKEVGLQLISLETESFALERALVGNDKNPIMIIDLGSRASSIIIFVDGIPVLNRSIDTGGNVISKSLSEVMGITYEQAEQFKRDMTLSASKEVVDKMPQQANFMINSIINEIRYILNIYQTQNKKPITKIVLTGGASFLMNIPEYIQQVFNVKSYVGDPWARVVHPVELDSFLKKLGPRMSVVIGLAMREIV